jgi:hypothetical protein
MKNTFEGVISARGSARSTQTPLPFLLSLNPKETAMVQIKLSEKQCLFCTKTETVVVKAHKEDFQAPVCMEHLRPLLQKWEPQPENTN